MTYSETIIFPIGGVVGSGPSGGTPGVNWETAVFDFDDGTGTVAGNDYIVTGTLGDFAGATLNDVAVYNAGTLSWDFFPPEEGDTRYVSNLNAQYLWNGVSWVMISQGEHPVIVSAPTPPAPTDGFLWSDSTNNVLYLYDTAISRWVSVDSFDVEGVIQSLGTDAYLFHQDVNIGNNMGTAPFILPQDSLLVELFTSQSTTGAPRAYNIQIHTPPFVPGSPTIIATLDNTTAPADSVDLSLSIVMTAGTEVAFRGIDGPGAGAQSVYVRARFKRLV